MECLVYSRRNFPILRKEKRKLPYFLVANWDIAIEKRKYSQESINTLLRKMMHIYIHDTLIPNMLEGISNGKTKDEILEKYGLKTLCEETIGEWITKLGFKYYYATNNPHTH